MPLSKAIIVPKHVQLSSLYRRDWRRHTDMGVAINTLVERFDEQGVAIGEQSTRQMAIMVGQVIEFARLRSLLASVTNQGVAAS